MPVFLQGRRAFLSSLRRRHRRGHSLSVHLASPVRASPVRASPTHAVPAPLPPPVTPTLPRLPRCRRLSLLPFLVYPAAATCHSYPHLVYPAAACHSYPHLVYPAAADFGYRSAARPAHVLLPCREHRHGPRFFCCSARGAHSPLLAPPILPGDTARAPFAVLPGAPVPALPGAQKRRTEPHRGPSAAKKQPICRGSITAAALQPVRSVHSPETNPLRIVRAGISG